MKTFVKYILALSLLIVMLLSTSSIALAENTNEYTIPELGLTMSVPTRMIVYTRDFCEDEELLSQAGLTYSALVSSFEANSIYLNAIDTIENQEIVVTMIDSDFSDFNTLGDTTLNILAETILPQYSDYGITVLSYDIYQHSQAKFIRIFFHDENNFIYGLQYYTVYDGKTMNFTLRSTGIPINSSKESLIKVVVDSIKYDNVEEQNGGFESTPSFCYTDNDSGVTFTVPKDWTQKELSQSRKTLDIMFQSNIDDAIILYGSTNLSDQLGYTESLGYSQEDFNFDNLTEQDFVDLFGYSSSDVQEVNYNGEKYFQLITSQPNATDSGLTVTMTVLLKYSNGWMYQFQFFGKPTHPLYPDFEKLMNTVEYPVTTSTVASAGEVGKVNDSHFLIIIITIVIVASLALGTSIFIIIYQRKRTKAVKNNNTSSPTSNDLSSVPTSQETKVEDRIELKKCNVTESNSQVTLGVFCHNCGKRLPDDSVFCFYCGTKLNIEVKQK